MGRRRRWRKRRDAWRRKGKEREREDRKSGSLAMEIWEKQIREKMVSAMSLVEVSGLLTSPAVNAD
jgi:hypothetical protein